jgi:hypothetical protein
MGPVDGGQIPDQLQRAPLGRLDAIFGADSGLQRVARVAGGHGVAIEIVGDRERIELARDRLIVAVEPLGVVGDMRRDAAQRPDQLRLAHQPTAPADLQLRAGAEGLTVHQANAEAAAIADHVGMIGVHELRALVEGEFGREHAAHRPGPPAAGAARLVERRADALPRQRVERRQPGESSADDGDAGRALREGRPARQGERPRPCAQRRDHAPPGDAAASGPRRTRARFLEIDRPRPLERPPDETPDGLPPSVDRGTLPQAARRREGRRRAGSHPATGPRAAGRAQPSASSCCSGSKRRQPPGPSFSSGRKRAL